MPQTRPPLRLLAEILGIVALAELAVMLVLPQLAGDLTPALSGILDVTLLVLLAAPATYWRCTRALHEPSEASDALPAGPASNPLLIPLVMQFLGLGLTVSLMIWIAYKSTEDAHTRFETLADHVQAEVTHRLELPLMTLRGARGAFAANNNVTRHEFQTLVQTGNTIAESQGVSALGFIEHVPRQRLEHFIRSERASLRTFSVDATDASTRDLYILKYIEPQEPNSALLGHDFGQDAVLREAMDQAIDTALPVLSAPVLLMQDNLAQGFYYFVPLYRQGLPRDTLAQRKEALQGLLVSTIVIQDMFEGIAEAADRLLQVQIHDGAQVDAKRRIYDSMLPDVSANPHIIEQTRIVNTGRRTLALRMASSTELLVPGGQSALIVTALVGTLASTLLALSVWLLASGRSRAQRMAQRMTADLDRLARVAQSTHNAVTIGDAKGRIIWVNEGFTRMTGYTLDEARGKTPNELLGSDKTSPDVLQGLHEAMAQGRAHRAEVINRAKDGHEYWVDTEVQPTFDAHGALKGFMEIGTDISALKQTQRKLEAAMRETQILLSAMEYQTIVSVSDRQGCIMEVNEAFCDISGYSREELVGQNHRIINSGMQPKAFWESMWATISTGSSWRGDICNRAKDGHLYWVDSIITPFIGDDGLVEKYVSIRTDITARIRDAQRLAELTDRMTLAIEGGSDGLWDWMDITQDEQWWAPNFYALLGYTPDEMPARSSNYIALIHPDSVPVSQAAWRDAFAGKRPYDVELQLRTKSRGYRWFRTRGKVHFDAQGRAVRLSGATQDIHDHKLAQLALAESQASLERMGEVAGVGGWSVDLKSGHVHWSKQTRRIHEVDDSYVPNLEETIRFYAPEARPVIEKAVQSGIVEGKGWDLELPFVTATGRAIWVRAVGTVQFENDQAVMLSGAFQDITERRQRDESLYLLELCISRIKDSILITDASDVHGSGPHIVFVNQAFEVLTGYNQSEVLGQTPRLLQGPDTDRAALARLHQAVDRGEPISEELLNYAKDGTPYWIEVSLSPVRSNMGEVTHFVAVERDVTARRRSDAELRDALERAQQASVSKSQFVANMSHEIRTPMNAILGLLKLLQSTDLTARQLDYVDKTEGAARSLLGLLNDILDFSKVEAGKMTLDPRAFTVDKLLRDLSVILSANLGAKNVEVLFDIDPQLPAALVGDDMRLQQVLINLSGNAIKFTAQGEVTLRLRCLERTDSDALVEFSVQDSGIGIAPENQAHIFSGFSQAEASTTRRFGGTGLGLAISSRLVGLMGGTLELVSAVGQGSTFHFQLRLPVAPAPVEPPTPAGLSILVVDDNAQARRVFCDMVAALGWKATPADNHEQALDCVRQRQSLGQGAFDAAFVDWAMPGIDGWSTGLRLRALMGSVPMPIFVMVSARGRELLTQRSAQEQAQINGFLIKPATTHMLREAVMDSHSGAAAAQAEPQKVVKPKRLAGLRLLVVEDNKINQMVARGLLQQEGAEVALADDGERGVQAVRNAQEPFDAVLMDVQMPVMDGYTAARVIRQELHLHSLPIIAMTANAMASDRAACLEAGMDDHVGKPFELDHLVATLLRLVTRAQAAKAPDLPPANVPAPAPTLQDLDAGHWDTRGALERMGNDEATYGAVLHSFARDMGQWPRQLEQAQEQGDTEAALRALHTQKGLAATVGARTLAATLQTLERTIKAQAPGVRLADVCEQVRTAVQAAQAELTPLLQRWDTSTAPSQPNTAPVTDDSVAHQRVLLQELLGLLRNSDLRALNVAAALRPLCVGTDAAFAQSLDAALQVFDFPRAVQLCEDALVRTACT
ncbi:MAG: PAS domain S-box protein [Rhodoferax sp.]